MSIVPNNERVSLRADHASRPLDGARICLVFEHDLSHYTRILQEAQALADAGASLQLLTCSPQPGPSPLGMETTRAPLAIFSATGKYGAGSSASSRALRIASNLTRMAFLEMRRALLHVPMSIARRQALDKIARQVDLLWVIDYPSLPSALSACRRNGIKLVYETVDLVPEFLYPREWQRAKHLRAEARLVSRIDGFITVCDGYADYYVERYSDAGLARRPFVRNDMPAAIAPHIHPTERPIRMLFLGGLMPDRPVRELMEALARTQADVTLTFQGPNHLGDAPATWIREFGIAGRVQLLDPCPADAIVEEASGYDVGIVALRGVDENERRASTTKLFTYMAAGLAILGSNLPGIARVVEQHGNGLLVDSMSPDDWAQTFERIAALPVGAIEIMKQQSLDGARAYAWEKQKPEFVQQFVLALGDM